MNLKLKILSILNQVVIIYLVLIALLLLSDKITFGYGLGDLFYLLFIAISTVAQTILTLIIKYKSSEKYKFIFYFIVATIFLIIAIDLTWEFTLGRGPEYNWDGYIFKQ